MERKKCFLWLRWLRIRLLSHKESGVQEKSSSTELFTNLFAVILILPMVDVHLAVPNRNFMVYEKYYTT